VLAAPSTTGSWPHTDVVKLHVYAFAMGTSAALLAPVVIVAV